MQSTETIELATRAPLPSSTSTLPYSRVEVIESDPRNESSLAPVDGGFGAWSFLAGAFIVETIVWGYPVAYGTFLSAYLNDPQYSTQPHASSVLPLVGPLSSGIIYGSTIFINPFMARYPHARRTLMWIGAVFCFTSLFGASFATKVVDLVVLQGFLYAIGGSLLYAPCILYMSEWFVKRRGMANGVIFAGTALGGFLFPLVLPGLLSRFGPAKALRVLSVALMGSVLPFLPFIKGRLPESRVHGPRPRSWDRSWMKSTSFWFVITANTVQGFGYFVPVVWLPTYATALNLSPTNASLTLALLNGASVVGRLGLGVLSDTMNPSALALCSLLITAISIFVLWGVLSNTFAGLIAFGIVYGMIAGGWTSLWTGFVRPFAKDDPTLSTSMFGYLLLSRGLGNILSSPISTSLLSGYASGSWGFHTAKTGFGVGGGQFANMIIYVGTCFACAALIVGVGWGLGVNKPKARRDMVLI
ncbi:MFS general substrate transporter [Leucogyrophana mollusca]|uniref:MFS general substrate transporter n=1 Tax=Leucogyrophana mollusca TaxID=85980 RepID=A0ACB8BJW5_9AGAM|nr:MFS general substrate transporter [Leucogyrophana mollusca]